MTGRYDTTPTDRDRAEARAALAAYQDWPHLRQAYVLAALGGAMSVFVTEVDSPEGARSVARSKALFEVYQEEQDR